MANTKITPTPAPTLKAEPTNADLIADILGSYVIVRSRDQGVMAGYLEGAVGQVVRLREARQVYEWDSKFVLPELASFGPRRAAGNRYGHPMAGVTIMTEACGILQCSPEATAALLAIPPQNP